MSSSNIKPIYLLAGGRGSSNRKGPDPILQRIFGETERQKPNVAYVGTASSDNKAFLFFMGRYLKKAGCGDVRLAPISSAHADIDKAKKVLEDADLVFMSGGDVEEGIRILREKAMDGFLKDLCFSGKLFVGLSAGSIMLANSWVRWKDPNDESTAEAFPCLGFAHLLCDTHGEAEDWEELKTLLSLCEEDTIGYGIPTSSALVCHPDGSVEALEGVIHRLRKTRNGVHRIEDLTRR